MHGARSGLDSALFARSRAGVLIANRAGAPSQTVGNPSSYATGTSHSSFAPEANTQFDCWSRHAIIASATGIAVDFCNYSVSANGLPAAGNPPAVVRCSIRPNCGGTGLPATAGTAGTDVVGRDEFGNSDVAIPPGEYRRLYFGGLTLSANTHILLKRRYIYAGVPATIPTTNMPLTGGFEYSGAGTDLPDRTTANSNSGRFTNYLTLPPLAIVGVPLAQPSFPRIMLLGASVFGEANDTSASQDAIFYKGFTTKGLKATWPWAQFSAPGRALGATGLLGFTLTQSDRLLDFIGRNGITHVVMGMGGNDMLNGGTAAQFLADMQTLRTLVVNRGARLICQTRETQTNSSNTAEQAAGRWAEINAINTAIIANNGVGHGYLPLRQWWQDGAQTNLWRTDLGSVPDDGVHPKVALHDYAATMLAAALPGLLA